MQQHPGYPPGHPQGGYRPPMPPMYRPGAPGTPGNNMARPPNQTPTAVKRPPPQGMLADSQKIKPVKQKKPGDRLLPPSVRDLVPESQGLIIFNISFVQVIFSLFRFATSRAQGRLYNHA